MCKAKDSVYTVRVMMAAMHREAPGGCCPKTTAHKGKPGQESERGQQGCDTMHLGNMNV